LGFEKGLFLRPAHAFLKMESHRHTGGSARGDVEPLSGRDRGGGHVGEVLLQVRLGRERAAGEVVGGAQQFGLEPGFGEATLVEGTEVAGLNQGLAQVFELEFGDAFDVPGFDSAASLRNSEKREPSRQPVGRWR
jgi:hypothetical protein